MAGLVTTQDVSFGACWTRLLGDRARWEPGTKQVDPLQVRGEDDVALFGAGLVAVWVEGDDGPVLICRPREGLKAIKDFDPPADPAALRAALRSGGAVVRELSAPSE